MSTAAIGLVATLLTSPAQADRMCRKVCHDGFCKSECVSSGHRLYMHEHDPYDQSARHARTGCECRNQPVGKRITQERAVWAALFHFRSKQWEQSADCRRVKSWRVKSRRQAPRTSRSERLRSKYSSRRRSLRPFAAATATPPQPPWPAPSTACVAAAAAPSVPPTASSSPPMASPVAAPSVSEQQYRYAACTGHFLVEDKESRQADVRDFLLSEDYRCGVLRRNNQPVSIEADAPPGSDNAPATPNAVTTLLRPFALEIGFECDISDLSGWPRTSDWGADVRGSNK